MPDSSTEPTRTPPESFGHHNREQYQRVVRLTGEAITQLENTHQPVTLTALAETTRALEGARKGLSSRTILRNTDAAALFRQHSSAYQARQFNAKKAKRKGARGRAKPEVLATYRGLHSAELIRIVEDQKMKIAELEERQTRLMVERDEAYHRRDEVLQHNARQLAALTASR